MSDLPARTVVSLDAASRHAIRSAVRWGVFWGLFLWFVVFPLVVLVLLVGASMVGLSIPFLLEGANPSPGGGTP